MATSKHCNACEHAKNLGGKAPTYMHLVMLVIWMGAAIGGVSLVVNGVFIIMSDEQGAILLGLFALAVGIFLIAFAVREICIPREYLWNTLFLSVDEEGSLHIHRHETDPSNGGTPCLMYARIVPRLAGGAVLEIPFGILGKTRTHGRTKWRVRRRGRYLVVTDRHGESHTLPIYQWVRLMIGDEIDVQEESLATLLQLMHAYDDWGFVHQAAVPASVMKDGETPSVAGNVYG